jgi:decaprenylphospho-beta-D-ribofuranose 2-oxidase
MDGTARSRRIDRRSDPEAFDTICGAMGLTGVILRAAIRLQPVETAWIRQEMIPAESVGRGHRRVRGQPRRALLRRLDRLHRPSPAPGRSLVMLGRHATLAELPPKTPPRALRARPGRLPLGVPFDLPGFVLNAANLRVFNALYYAMGRRKAGVSLIDWDRYFYPLDSIANWNRIYGRAGFYQFQCALPLDGVRAALTQMLGEISEAGTGSFLSVLKRFGRVRGAIPSRSKATRWRSISRPMTAAAR